MTQYAGKATIRLDGEVLSTDAGATLDVGGATRTSVVGANQVLGYSESPKPAHLECDVFVNKDTQLESFRQAREATITFEADSGNTWVLTGAWLMEPPTFTQAGEGGKARLVFESTPAQEI